MDDDSFKTELLSRMDRIQSLLSYLCSAAKASEERAQALGTAKNPAGADRQDDNQIALERSLLQEEMQDDYYQAVQKWKSGQDGR